MDQAQSPAERRKHERVRVEFSVTFAFSGGQTVGEGKLANLSESGCAVEGNKTIPVGAFVLLKILPPDEPTPIIVDSAAVKWVKGRDFGVEFKKTKPEQMERLRAYLKNAQGNDPASAPQT